MSPCLHCVLIGAITLIIGCSQKGPEPVSPATSRPSVALRIVVVNEPLLAEAIGRLRGEWNERSGGELNTSTTSWQELSHDETLDDDIVVFPSRYLGEFCVRDWLRPVRANVLESGALAMEDIFPIIRRELIQWGGQVMALPLSVSLPNPREPIERNPAIWFLARAAPNIITDDRIGVLFDPETMKPRIAEPPFVKALQGLATSRDDGSTDVDVESQLPVLGFRDRLAAVTTASRNAASAFKLLEWLAERDTSSQLIAAGDDTMPVRRSLMSSRALSDLNVSANELAQRAKMLEVLLTRQQCLLIPRIPRIDDYMTALDQAVRDAVSGDLSAKNALERAALSWDEITDEGGRDKQRLAYVRHLGIE
jgi:hypothetical protein